MLGDTPWPEVLHPAGASKQPHTRFAENTCCWILGTACVLIGLSTLYESHHGRRRVVLLSHDLLV